MIFSHRSLEEIRRIGALYQEMLKRKLVVEDALMGTGNGALLWRINDCIIYAPDNGKVIPFDEKPSEDVERTLALIHEAEAA